LVLAFREVSFFGKVLIVYRTGKVDIAVLVVYQDWSAHLQGE
jgi:hypothetical protein